MGWCDMKIRNILLVMAIVLLQACGKSSEQPDDPSIKAARNTIDAANKFPENLAWRSLTPQVFVGKFNALAAKRGIDVISNYKSIKNVYIARPDDIKYKEWIEELVRDGRVERKFYVNFASLSFSVNSSNKIFTIVVHGSKSDPANKEEFLSMVEIVNEILNPAVSDYDNAELLSALGLTGASVKESMGKAITRVSGGGKFTCLYKQKNEYKSATCVITSRE